MSIEARSEKPAAGVRLVRVEPDRAGQRLDNFLLGQLKGAPRSLVYKIVRSGQVRVNGGRAKAERRLEAGDEVRIPPVRLAEAESSGPVPKGLNLWTYRRILDRGNFAGGWLRPHAFESDVCLVNWPQNDYWLGNLYDAPDAEVDASNRLGRELSLSLLYWMQTEAPRPDGRHGWRGLRLRGDVTGTEDGDGLAMAPYIRESRPEIAALNMGTMNYSKYSRARKAFDFDMIFPNTYDKIIKLLHAMNESGGLCPAILGAAALEP